MLTEMYTVSLRSSEQARIVLLQQCRAMTNKRKSMKELYPNPLRKQIVFVFSALLIVLWFSRPEFAHQSPATIQREAPPSSTSDLVKLNVSVRDKKGNFVSRLNYYDFEVYCDNAPQQVRYFSRKD